MALGFITKCGVAGGGTNVGLGMNLHSTRLLDLKVEINRELVQENEARRSP